MHWKKIGIGTVQWGTSYGISNKHGQTSVDESKNILNIATRAGISLIDTALLYGSSEYVLGQSKLHSFNVVTKSRSFSGLVIKREHGRLLSSDFSESLGKLNIQSSYGLLIHDANCLFLPGAQHLVDALLMLKEQGKVYKVGCSIYNVKQLENVLSLFVPDIVQLPINVFDQRLLRDGTIHNLASLGVEIHARSVFLQGLLLMDPKTLPSHFSPWLEYIKNWQHLCCKYRVLPQIAALKWVCDIPQISYTLVGIQNPFQLEQLLVSPTEEIPRDEFDLLARTEEELLNPSNWPI